MLVQSLNKSSKVVPLIFKVSFKSDVLKFTQPLNLIDVNVSFPNAINLYIKPPKSSKLTSLICPTTLIL